VRRKRSMSVGGHQMTRAEKLSLPQLYNQSLYTAYYIRMGASRKGSFVHIVPLDPAYKAGLAGHVPAKEKIRPQSIQTAS
jgi:hypothetical protein